MSAVLFIHSASKFISLAIGSLLSLLDAPKLPWFHFIDKKDGAGGRGAEGNR